MKTIIRVSSRFYLDLYIYFTVCLITTVEPVTLDIPTLPPSLPDPNLVASPRSGANRGSRCHMNVPLVAFKSKPRWGQKQKDTSLLDEAERERLAEERRRRHAAMMEKHKARKGGDREDGAYGGPNFEDCE